MTPDEHFARCCADYKRWYIEGRWTFERFEQAIDDAARAIFGQAVGERRT